MAIRGVILGDSTVAAYLGGAALVGLLDLPQDMLDLSVPGDRIADQRSAWQAALPLANTPDWIMVQIGLNDLLPENTSSGVIAALQSLVDLLRSDAGPGVSVLIAGMIPCRSRLTDLYGEAGGAKAQRIWDKVNEAISGAGPRAITGVSARVTSHVAAMGTPGGDLAPDFDTGDGIHPNTAGRRINAAAWHAALVGWKSEG